MNSLIEKATDQMYDSDVWSSFWSHKEARKLAMAVIDATLEHFSDPANVTLRMMDAFAFHDGGKTIDDFARGFAAAMKAAKEEMR